MEILVIFIVVFIIYVISEATGYMSFKGREDFEDDNYSEEIKGSSKGVSEPVITFVELVKNNPKRFWSKSVYALGGYYEYFLIDKEFKACYCVSVYCHWGDKSFIPIQAVTKGNVRLKNVQNLDWITEEEWQYINKHLIKGIYGKRVNRFNEIKNLRKKRKEQKEKDLQRQKIKDLYIKQEK